MGGDKNFVGESTGGILPSGGISKFLAGGEGLTPIWKTLTSPLGGFPTSL